jgi:hypothetical protein
VASEWKNGYKLASRASKRHIPLIALTPQEQFRHCIARIILTSMAPDTHPPLIPNPPGAMPGLRKVQPYWYPYTTMAKLRWLERELLEVVSSEFRDRSMEYYVRLGAARASSLSNGS